MSKTADRRKHWLAVLAALMLAGCAETSGAQREIAEGLSLGSAGARGQGLPLKLGPRPGPAPDVLGPYLLFLNTKRVELSRAALSTRERLAGARALLTLHSLVTARDTRALAGTSPEALYTRCLAEAAAHLREDEALAAAQDAKLEEYWQWALWQWSEANLQPHRAGKAYLVTESPCSVRPGMR